VDKNSKSFDSVPSFPCKSSWDFCNKRESDSAILQWRLSFQAADSRERNFLDLLDDDLNPIVPSNIKGLGYITSACQTYCVLELLGPLSITLLLANISWDSSLGKISHVLAACILSKQEDTYYIYVVCSTNTEILEGTLLLTLLYFSNLILVLFLSNLSLIISSMVSTTIFYLFFLFLFFSFSLHVVSVCMYVVTK